MSVSENNKDSQIAVRSINAVPVISADMYAHMGKFSGAIIMSVFHQIGGIDRMASWADQNYTDFATKLFPKLIQRSTAVEHSGNITIDDAISRLERMEEADFDEVPVNQDYDL